MKRPTGRDLGSLAFVVAGIAAFFLFARTPATNVGAAFDGEPQIVAATFASAWCSACKILKPRLAKAIPRLAGEPVRFVEYDFTFGDRPETRGAAERDGIGPLYARLAGATGFTVLVDADTGEVIDTLTINHSAAAMEEAVRRAVAVTAARP
jgi:hypothetical protein